MPHSEAPLKVDKNLDFFFFPQEDLQSGEMQNDWASFPFSSSILGVVGKLQGCEMGDSREGGDPPPTGMQASGLRS